MPLEGYQFTCDNCGHQKLEKKFPQKIILQIGAKYESTEDCRSLKVTEMTICQECRPGCININKHLLIKSIGHVNEMHLLSTFVSELEVPEN